MSEALNNLKGSAARVTESLGAVPSLGARAQSKIQPVQLWAIAGGLILAFQLFVWIKWVTGPYFVEVPTGPSEPPIEMKIALIIWTGVIMTGFPIAIWYFLIRPWRRERRITTDGMLMMSTGLFFFQDPLLNYFNTWCSYNTWMWNRGSWVQDIPGWMSWGKPGAMMPEPLLMNLPGYSFGVLMILIAGCWVMRKTKERWPNISNLGLLGVLFLWTFVFDVIMEGYFLMPMGLYVYPGAIQSLSINAGTYYQWPLYEGVLYGGVMAGLCALRFFTDDKGRTYVEKGLDQIQGGFFKEQLTRFLAIFAACSMIFFCLYNVPVQFFALHADPWPEDIQKRSYFTMGVCGEGTGRLCPHPALPIDQGEASIYVDPDGNVVIPEGTELPKIVPFERGEK